MSRPDEIIELTTGIYSATLGGAAAGATAAARLAQQQLDEYHRLYRPRCARCRRPCDVKTDFGRTWACSACPPNLTPDASRYRSNCRNCGAPHEPVRCSYCTTPSQP